jgi:alpha-amylase/alpha-mannosidase (GH57 family)
MVPPTVTTTRYVCVHGHFYQPPRENPWLEAIELQDSAYPFHDWNERVTAECYAPNRASRILDAGNRIAKIVNNYARISFDFGPTLLSWLQEKAPDTYRKILVADSASAQHFGGHGSAMAQCYNHMIMPLANERDKYTQVYWGIEDFRHRFGRAPEGMWLPETAVDLETLDILAQLGIRFTVLAPSQAKSMDGQDVTGQRIDPTRAYLHKLPSGRTINLFFYDGPISRSVAFEGLLKNGEHFARRLLDAFSDRRDWPQLAHIATDGETYGHHHAYGDMALAYALEHIETNALAKLTNYGEYLELHPPSHEVEVLENTSWSCVHGIGRWSDNCGCNSGGHGDWNQAWRAPLREALDWLRDETARCYEQAGSRCFKDPWAARNDYIHVLLDRSLESRERFAERNFRRKRLSQAERVTAWKLLELQRHAMLMYTSCGWFFDELSGIETVQVIQYAARVVELAGQLVGDSFEQRFLERLALAPSNIPEHRDGAAIYEKFVKPARVDMPKLCAHYAMSSLVEEYPPQSRIYSYSVDRKAYRVKRSGKMRLAFGHAQITSEITRESEAWMFGLLHLGDHQLYCGVAPFSDDYARIAGRIRDAFNRSNLMETMHAIEDGFKGPAYSLKDLLRDEQRKVMGHVTGSALKESESIFRRIYEGQAPLLQVLNEYHIPVPKQMGATAEIALNNLARQAVEAPELGLSYIQGLLDEFRMAGVRLDTAALEMPLRRSLELNCQDFYRNPHDLPSLRKCREQVAAAKLLKLPLALWSIQNNSYEIFETVYPEMKRSNAFEWLGEFDQLADLLNLKRT